MFYERNVIKLNLLTYVIVYQSYWSRLWGYSQWSHRHYLQNVNKILDVPLNLWKGYFRFTSRIYHVRFYNFENIFENKKGSPKHKENEQSF